MIVDWDPNVKSPMFSYNEVMEDVVAFWSKKANQFWTFLKASLRDSFLSIQK